MPTALSDVEAGVRVKGPSSQLSDPDRTFPVFVSGARAIFRQRLSSASAHQLSKMLNEQFSKNSNLPRGALAGRPDDEHASRRDRITRHQRNEGPRLQIVLNEVIRKPSDAEPRHRGSGECGTVVSFEPPVRMNGNCLVAINKLPGFRSLHERLMGKQLVRCLGSPVLPDIVRACDELSSNRSDTTCDQVRVGEIADTYRTVETLPDDIHETIAVARMYVEQRVAPRQFGKYRRQMCRSQG